MLDRPLRPLSVQSSLGRDTPRWEVAVRTTAAGARGHRLGWLDARRVADELDVEAATGAFHAGRAPDGATLLGSHRSLRACSRGG